MGKNIDDIIKRLDAAVPKEIEFEYFKRDKIVARIKFNVKENTIEQTMYTDKPLDIPITNPIKNKKTLWEFFESRTFPRTRANAQEVLEGLGLSYYDPYDIVKITRGRLWDDFYWIRFKGDNATFDEIKLRD